MSVANLLVVLAWGVVSLGVLLRRSQPDAQGDFFDPARRRLVAMTAFYLLVPAVVLGSQLLQVVLLHAAGERVGRFEPWVYGGIVEPAFGSELSPLARAGIASVGPTSLVLVAGALVSLTLLRPGTAARNHLLVETSRGLLILGFGVQPLLSLVLSAGDTVTVREALNARHPASGDVTLLCYGILAAWAFARWRGAHRLRLLGTLVHDVARDAGDRSNERPHDPDALRTLGAARLATGDPRAIAILARASAHGPDDPRTELLLGRAYLAQGRASEAVERLRRAGQALEDHGEDPRLLLEVTLALGAACIELGDAEAAILAAEEARAQAPRDVRALILLADALVTATRRDEARHTLEQARAGAQGALRGEIDRRLAALARSA